MPGERPFVFINTAVTADGKIDTVERRGAPISSPADFERVHRLRASAGAIMVGGRTLLREDPNLTVKPEHLRAERVARGLGANPIKVGIVSRIEDPSAGPSIASDGKFLNAGGARVVVFPEAFVPGYPAWIWRLRPGGDMALSERLHRALLDNAVNLATDDLGPLREAAREHKVTVVCGIDERDGGYSRGTLYNTVVTIGADGSVLNRHRKLMPTNPERMVWGTDWPHPNIKKHMPDDGALVDLLADIAPSREHLDKLLVGNPTRLYWPEEIS